MLSLIPAKYYYDDATQDQWKQKKKLKQEQRQNKRAKLDPLSKDSADDYANGHALAKHVKDNKAKKGKPVKLPGAATLRGPVPVAKASNNDEDDDDEAESLDSLMALDSVTVFDDNGDEVEDASEDASEAAEDDAATETQTANDDNATTTDESHSVKEKAKNAKAQLLEQERKAREEKLAALRQRLTLKISQMKEKRKAVGSKAEGAPKSRQQILEERKRKAELRKKRKREEEEEQADDSDSDNDDNDNDNEANDADEVGAKNLTFFGNIVFNDGTRVTSDLTKLRNTAEKKKRKGPANNDIKAHLAILEKKKERFAKLLPEQQQKELEKEKWQKVMTQAEGVKLKDDEKLLKKALKRKEKQKLKLEREWQERTQTVKDTKAARQKRREENLQARRDAKGVRGKKKKQLPRLKKFTGIANKAGGKTGGKAGGKKRAGFEGSAKLKKK